MRLRNFLRRVEQGARKIFVRRDELARAMQPLEDRVGLDGELIEREMLARHLDCFGELGAPRPFGLAGPRVNQVERGARKNGLSGLHRRDRLCDAVATAESLQVGVVERLHADREPVDAGGAVAAKAARLDAGRVGLERDLRVGLDGPVLGDGVDDVLHRLGAHQGGRAATEEDRAHLAPFRFSGAMGKFRAEGGDVTVLVDRACPDMRVEIAIRALGETERPVDVDGEAGVPARLTIRECGGSFEGNHLHVMPF